MTSITVDAQLMYRMFGGIYYEQELPNYSLSEVSTTQAVQCLTKSFSERRFKRAPAEPKTVILSFGRLVHIGLQQQLRKVGYETEVEKAYDLENCTLWTHADAIHSDHVLEIKTCSSIPHNILYHHFLQANTYAMVHGKTKGHVVYVHKPSGICKVMDFVPNTDSFILVCARAMRLAKYLHDNVMPPPEPSWLCQYCEYLDICPLKRGRNRPTNSIL
jgi:CRISPR/Cas system-associated exonuclease Cas4 (RecB family)